MAEVEKELTLERAREILQDEKMSNERLEGIIKSIKVLCKVAYELYVKELEMERENFPLKQAS